jgi:predicted metal-dependent hydrolase
MIRNESVIIILLLISVIIYIRFSYNDVVYVKSNIDDNYYLVRDLPDKQRSADLLSNIKKKIFILVDHLVKNKNKKEYIKYKKYINQLEERIQNVVITETSKNSSYTSYSINKGEQIIFCLRSRTKEEDSIHDINLLMYVVLHEIAHVACPEYGHGALFKRIFAFITLEAIKIKLYTKIDFNNKNEEYCGLTITDSII